MKRHKHFKAGVEEREFYLIKALLKAMYSEYCDVHNTTIDNADELHIKIDCTL